MDLLSKVKALYKLHYKVGELNGVHYDYTCPSLTNYPHQWLWDSSFHSIVLSNFDINRAKREILTLFLNQSENGFVPCVTIWKKRFPFEEMFYMTKITQPPVPPIAVEIIYQKSHDIKFLNETYPKLALFMDWFYEKRDLDNIGLIKIIHPWETGIDSSPAFDKQLGVKINNPSFFEVMARFYWIIFNKKFASENVLMNSIYAKSLKSMSRLANIVNKTDDAKKYNTRYKQAVDSLIKYCWSDTDKIFYDLDNDRKQIKIKTISSLMPLIIEDLPKKYVVNLISKHLLNNKEFWSNYPLSSVSMDEKTFNPGKSIVLWRGPTWINTNWFLIKSLIYFGYTREANDLILKTKFLVEQKGFWEFYNPDTGEGYGQPNLSWSALVLDIINLQK